MAAPHDAHTLDAKALDQLFREARTHNAWTDRPVTDETLHQLYDLMKWGPTSANISPARLLFLKSKQAKEKLRPHLQAGNIDKTMSAPVVAILGHDLRFYEHMEKLFPHNPGARGWFEGNDALIQASAFRNGTLQGAYLILAARALGLDTGPMSGFDNAGDDRTFFPEGHVKSNFLINLGYGDPKGLFPRSPRFAFGEVAKIL